MSKTALTCASWDAPNRGLVFVQDVQGASKMLDGELDWKAIVNAI